MPALLTVPVLGSSPCVWGQDSVYLCGCNCHRIIPMRVGTRALSLLDIANCRDHPHACGDKVRRYDKRNSIIGSSPCVWGQGSDILRYSRRGGIIPMRVGTRSAWDNAMWINKDHPHACGDKFAKTSHQQTPLGSSPCVWGQAHKRLKKPVGLRIIPMRVGTSCPCVRACCARQDHPHACGDKLAELCAVLP